MSEKILTSNQSIDWRALCLKVRDAVAAEGEAMRWSSGVGAARRKLAAVWEEVAQAERLPVETKVCGDVWTGSLHAVCQLPLGHTGDHRGGYQYAWTNLTPASAFYASRRAVHGDIFPYEPWPRY